MKILVTGGSGFIGTNFVLKQILDTKNQILNIDKLTYAGNESNLDSINNNPRYKFINGDICNYSLIVEAISTFRPNALVNFAAESHVDRSIDGPMDFIQTNVVGTATLLEACRNIYKNLKFRFLHVSTDEVYGSLGRKGSFTEETPYNPSSPYSASKAASDHLVRSWGRTYDFPILITNCSNNYGPFQFPEKLIPLMIANCLNEKQLPIYGKGENVRDWLYVDDHCDAIYTVLTKGRDGETYNIGGNNEISNIEIVNKICSIIDEIKPRDCGESYKKLISFVNDRPGHDFRYAIDASKIKNELGWHPKETFETGIRKTISWYLNNELFWKSLQKQNYNQERLGLNK